MVNSDGGLWLVLINALLFIPLVMAACFYPMEVLLATGVTLLVAFAGYEAYVFWRRRHIRA